MSSDEARAAAAAALRDLIHAFAAHDPENAELEVIASTATSLTAQLERADTRDRMALMRSAVTAGGAPAFPEMTAGSGFSDRAVGGATNPASVDLDVRFEGEEVVATVCCAGHSKVRAGPRRHRVAAAFDDVTGFVIGIPREPRSMASPVRYRGSRRPALEMRARSERRKLFIEAGASRRRARRDVKRSTSPWTCAVAARRPR
jgi:hypothetical protein